MEKKMISIQMKRAKVIMENFAERKISVSTCEYCGRINKGERYSSDCLEYVPRKVENDDEKYCMCRCHDDE